MLTPPGKLQNYALIIRIGYPSSPEDQRACCAELYARRCWVGRGQPGREAWEAYERERTEAAT